MYLYLEGLHVHIIAHRFLLSYVFLLEENNYWGVK